MYIPAVKAQNNQFSSKEVTYRLVFGTTAKETYQEALNAATEAAIRDRKDPPFVRADGLEFKKDTITPVVLKEVELLEATPSTPQKESK